MAATEFELIRRYFSALGRGPHVSLGVGDDAALLLPPAHSELVLSVDTVIAGVHFPEHSFPEDIAYRAVAAAASDLAAMGAEPMGMTLALSLPEADELWLHAFSQGLAQACSAFGLPLVGGDTTRGALSCSVQVIGAVPRGQALLRSGAGPGEQVCVSGTLGDAAAGLALLQGEWQLADEAAADYLQQRFYRPSPRLQLGAVLRGIATAAIDVSDGLLADLEHLAAASGVSVQLNAQDLPLSQALREHAVEAQCLQWALTGGDDYELCFTLPIGLALPPGCVCIGSTAVGQGVHCAGAPVRASGYRHF